MGSSKKHKEKDKDRERSKRRERDRKHREKDRDRETEKDTSSRRREDRDREKRNRGSEEEVERVDRKKLKKDEYDDLYEYAIEESVREDQTQSKWFAFKTKSQPALLLNCEVNPVLHCDSSDSFSEYYCNCLNCFITAMIISFIHPLICSSIYESVHIIYIFTHAGLC